MKLKYKELYDFAEKNGFTIGYVRYTNNFYRVTIFKNEFQFNLSNFSLDGLKEQILKCKNNLN